MVFFFLINELFMTGEIDLDRDFVFLQFPILFLSLGKEMNRTSQVLRESFCVSMHCMVICAGHGGKSVRN